MEKYLLTDNIKLIVSKVSSNLTTSPIVLITEDLDSHSGRVGKKLEDLYGKNYKKLYKTYNSNVRDLTLYIGSGCVQIKCPDLPEPDTFYTVSNISHQPEINKYLKYLDIEKGIIKAEDISVLLRSTADPEYDAKKNPSIDIKFTCPKIEDEYKGAVEETKRYLNFSMYRKTKTRHVGNRYDHSTGTYYYLCDVMQETSSPKDSNMFEPGVIVSRDIPEGCKTTADVLKKSRTLLFLPDTEFKKRLMVDAGKVVEPDEKLKYVVTDLADYDILVRERIDPEMPDYTTLNICYPEFKRLIGNLRYRIELDKDENDEIVFTKPIPDSCIPELRKLVYDMSRLILIPCLRYDFDRKTPITARLNSLHKQYVECVDEPEDSFVVDAGVVVLSILFTSSSDFNSTYFTGLLEQLGIPFTSIIQDVIKDIKESEHKELGFPEFLDNLGMTTKYSGALNFYASIVSDSSWDDLISGDFILSDLLKKIYEDGTYVETVNNVTLGDSDLVSSIDIPGIYKYYTRILGEKDIPEGTKELIVSRNFNIVYLQTKQNG